MRPLGLYLHIPFCKAKCIYCDFYSLPHSEEKMDAYTAALQRDLIRWADQAKDHTVDTIYFGGGTPSYLGAERLCRLLETVFAHYRVDKNDEITTEANPDSAREVLALRQLREAGFNRISLGMQSASDDELRLIGRVHTHKETVEAVRAARAAGFDNVSLDLIYGLPEQTMAHWRENLQAAIALEPEHLSCYGLKIEEGTPLDRKKNTLRIPDDDEQAEEYLATVELLEKAGYAQYEISNFARPGRESRHNLKYWTMQEYLGFGPGAHSDFGGRRFAYARDLNAYIKGGEHLSESACPAEREREEERVMLALRTGARPVGAQGGHAGRRGSARRVRAPRPFPKGKRPLAPDAAGLSSVKRRHRAGARGAFPLNFAKKVETFSAFSRLYLWQGICYTVLCLPIQGIFSKEANREIYHP